MQQKIHMQDQVTNRIEMIMNDHYEFMKQVVDDVISFILVVVILAIGVLW